MKVLVCGGRDYADARFLFDHLDRVHRQIGIAEIIHVAARGADTLVGNLEVQERLPYANFLQIGKHMDELRGPSETSRC
ncbi:DUF2493 domain-containing protein [Anderseniella sp. Alg231-50]|uniref:DUF2493 domain-containing protein n=1 Tax=Anderseniella sp. Alg231-50 TaxID=1922226 RepID=UPI000D55F0AB